MERTAGPRHWVGIEKGWEGKGGNPLDHLVSLDAHRLATHCLVLGATGGGKTNLIHHVVAGAALAGRSLVVLDLRGDLVASCLEILAAAGTDPRLVEAIDLRERDRPTGWNPLGGEGESYFAALGVLDAIEAEHKELGVQLAETLRYALMLLAECAEPLTRLESLFYDGGFLRSCIERCVSENVAAFWERFDALSTDRRQALAMPVVNKVSMLFATEGLRRTFGHPSPLDLRRHLDTPGSALLVSLACGRAARGRAHGGPDAPRRRSGARCPRASNVSEARRNRVLLVVDEFENFAGRDFESILAEGSAASGCQPSRLAPDALAAEPAARARILLGNVGVKVAFRLGRDDSATMSRDMTGDPKGARPRLPAHGRVRDVDARRKRIKVRRGQRGPSSVRRRPALDAAREGSPARRCRDRSAPVLPAPALVVPPAEPATNVPALPERDRQEKRAKRPADASGVPASEQRPRDGPRRARTWRTGSRDPPDGTRRAAPPRPRP